MVRSAQLLRENNRRLQDYYNVQDADKLKQEQYQKKIQQAVKENPALKKSKKYRVLEYAYLQKLKEVHEQQRDLDRHLEERIYQDILKEGGIEQQKKKKKLPALPCSSYLFLLILYIYRGCPNAVSETLITVDEAQNLAPEEYRLIRDVNQEQAVLNLFGDVRQHIAGTKGIDTWEELEEIAEFEQHSMRENYRNARQITEYCNQRFGMDMHAINLDRQEVHEWLNIEQFRTGMEQQLRGTHRAGMSAIIVTTAEEAAFILEKYADFANKMHDFAAEGILHHSRWNIMTADEVKGLEFSTVIALSGRMSDNEKYIAYTRALDTLYVYDISIRIKKSDKKKAEKKSGTDKSGKKADQKKTGSGTDKTSKKKRARSDSDTGKNDYSNSKVKKFFEDAGLQVADLREEGGSLWVIGEKDRIRSTVNKAVDLFDITGVYGSDQKAKIKAGWHTKTKL